jgi:hypothetical protein
MRSSRRWFGCTSGFAGMCVVLFMALPESETPRTLVRGRVTHNGHAVTGAAVAFAPVRTISECPSGPIDASGCFLVESVWPKDGRPTDLYRIYFLPFRGQDDPPAFPPRYTDPLTSGLEVALGSEPTYLEIQLKD